MRALKPKKEIYIVEELRTETVRLTYEVTADSEGEAQDRVIYDHEGRQTDSMTIKSTLDNVIAYHISLRDVMHPPIGVDSKS